MPVLLGVRGLDLCGLNQLAGAFPSAQQATNPGTAWPLGWWLRLAALVSWPSGAVLYRPSVPCLWSQSLLESRGIPEARGIRKMGVALRRGWSLKVTACGGGGRKEYGRLVSEVVSKFSSPGGLQQTMPVSVVQSVWSTKNIPGCRGGSPRERWGMVQGTECACVSVYVCACSCIHMCVSVYGD